MRSFVAGALVVVLLAGGARAQISADLQETLAQLEDGSSRQRLHAVWQLGEWRAKEAVGALTPLLEDPDWNLRRVTVAALARILPAEDRTDALLPRLGDEHPQVREVTIQSLRGLDDPRLIPAFRRCLEDAHPLVRSAAVAALAARADPELSEAIAPLCRDDDPRVRRRAIEAVAAAPHGDALSTFLSALEDEDALNRMKAAEGLRELADPGATEALIEHLRNDPDPRVRRESGRAFLKVPDPAGLAAVARALETEPDGAVRNAFVFTLKHATDQDFAEDSGAWLAWLGDHRRP